MVLLNKQKKTKIVTNSGKKNSVSIGLPVDTTTNNILQKYDDMKKMYSIVSNGLGDYRLISLPKPKIKKNEILIKMLGCGICASDVHCYNGAESYWGNLTTIPWSKTPATIGHEFFGVIEEIDENVAERMNLSVGDKVIPEQIVPCYVCRHCMNGFYYMCEKHHIYGFQGTTADGGMSQYMICRPNSIIHKIPRSISANKGLLIEPFSCGLHAVERAEIKESEIVVIAGAGPLGLGMVQAASIIRPKKIIVIDRIPLRLRLAKSFGADVVLCLGKDKVQEEVKNITEGYGCDVYIEATGHPSAVSQGLKMIRRKGKYIEFGVFSRKANIDWSIIGDKKELNVIGSHLGPKCYNRIINGFNKGTHFDSGVITDINFIEDWESAFISSARSDAIKSILI